MVELLGYLATTLVAASFLLKDVIKLRLVNAIGAACFVVYGLIVGTYPVALLNAFLVCVNGYYIWKARQENTPSSK